MEMVAGKPRQRTWKPKARSGCKTCKIRRVKCDEEKPQCQRCTSTGRKCDGYDTTFYSYRSPTSSPPETRPTPPRLEVSRTVIRSQSPISLAPAIHLDTDEERESFDFFASYAITKLRGFLDSPFWQRQVLQAAHREPAIQHCVVAMGAIYRRFYEGQHSHLTESAMSEKYLQFAFLQSNRAIKLLLDKPGSPPDAKDSRAKKITLMTCAILFSSMCCLQGYQRHAVEHLRSGIRLLNEMDEAGGQKENTEDLDSLRTIFVALDAQIRAIMPSTESRSWVAKPRTAHSCVSLDENGKLHMPTLLAVLEYMESLLSHTHAFNQKTFLREPGQQNAHGEVALELHHLVRRYERGARVMHQLWDEAARSSRDDFILPLTALELLQAQVEYLLRHPRTDILAKFPCLAAFQGAREPFDAPFDEAAHFFKIFELCSRLLVGPGNKAAPVFMTSMGPTAALWFVAVRAPASCQALRRRAMELMLRYPRREGFWDGMMAGRIAKEALALEQKRTRAELGVFDDGSVEDLEVPKHLRIISFWLTYPEDEDRKVRVGFSDEQDLAVGVPGAVREFTW